MNDTLIKLLSGQSGNGQPVDKITKLPEISLKSRDIKELTPLFDAIKSEGVQHKSPVWASHMTPTVDDTSLLGHLLSAQHNGNLLSPQLYPLLIQIEQQTLQWFCQQFSMPYGHFTSGSTYGTLEALWQAREADPSRTTVYASHAAHYSVAKACQILGLAFQALPTDDNDQLNIGSLHTTCQDNPPLAIVATAGTPASGAIDPIRECVNLAKKYNSWLHIDAAWGGTLALVPEYRHYLEGIAGADSLCFDPHKTLGQPKPTSLLFYQQPLKHILNEKIDYLDPQPSAQLIGSHGGEHCLSLWSYLMLKGTDAITDSIQQRLAEAQCFANDLRPIASWINLSPTGIVCFTLPASHANIDKLVSQGVFSKAFVNSRPIYRAVFADTTTCAAALLKLIENA